jgi:hypothetical protein
MSLSINNISSFDLYKSAVMDHKAALPENLKSESAIAQLIHIFCG